MAKMNSNLNLNAENKLSGKWARAAAVLDKFAVQTADDVFRKLKYIVAEKINTICGSDESLSAYDVQIYEAYKRIIRAYGEVVGIYLDKDRAITSPYAKGIWDGIYAVLMSRLLANQENVVTGDPVNPVWAEKKEIVARAILSASERLEAAMTKIAAPHRQSWCMVARRLFDNMDFDTATDVTFEIADDIRQKCGQVFYDVYVATVKMAIVNLNDLSSRRDVSYYFELLKEEQEILRQILVVQVAALEEFIYEGQSEGSEGDGAGEAAILQEALTVLRETYQRESAEINQIDKLFSESAARNKENLGQVVITVEGAEEFAASLEEAAAFGEGWPAVFEQLKQNFDEKRAAFEDAVKELVTKRTSAMQSRLTMQKVYFCKKAVSELVYAAREVCSCFGGILEHFEENKEGLGACEERDIVAGVTETVLIKIESLNESIDGFEKEADKLVGGFFQADMETDDTMLAGLIGRLASELNLPDFEGGRLLNIIAGDEIFVKYREGIEKALAKKEEGLEKKSLAFKRDNFLFELTTFEEIMYYSVSRLRESTGEEVLAFVREIDKAHKAIGRVLTKYGIEKIAPAAHDIFNPKENEVLMAEESEAFKKGEIIKTINSGYRQNGVVIVRANVIAAK